MDLELLLKLKAITPKDPLFHINLCKEQTNSKRINLLLKERGAFFFNYLEQTKKNEKEKVKKTLLTDFLHPQVSKPFIGISQTSQNSSFLLTYVHNDPEILAKLVISAFNSKKFSYFIQVSFPSLFGFFCANEYLDLAFPVYEKLIKTAPEKVVIDVFSPLLNSSCTFRFIEHALTSFFHTLQEMIVTIVDINNEDAISGFAFLLVDSYQKALPLLPPQILNLLKLVYNQFNNLSSFIVLFVINFLFKNAMQWKKTKHINISDELLKKIFDGVAKNKEKLSKFYKQIQSTESSFKLPSLYQAFSLDMITFLMTIRDITLVVKLMNQFSLMPSALSYTDFLIFDKEAYNNIFIVQLYKQLPIPNIFNPKIIFTDNYKEQMKYNAMKEENESNFNQTNENLKENRIQENSRKLRALESKFENDDKSIIDFVLSLHDKSQTDFQNFVISNIIDNFIQKQEQFEQFIIEKTDLQVFSDWFDVVCSYESFIYSLYLESYVYKIHTGENLPHSRKHMIFHLIKSISNEQLIKSVVLMNADNTIQLNISNAKDSLKELDSNWFQHIKKLKKEQITDTKEKKVEFAIISLLRSVNSTPLFISYQSLQKMMNILSIIKEYKDKYKIFLNAFYFLDKSSFLSCFMLLSALVLNNYKFSNYFEDNEKDNWFILEKMVSQTVSSNEKFFGAYAQTQELVTINMKTVI